MPLSRRGPPTSLALALACSGVALAAPAPAALATFRVRVAPTAELAIEASFPPGTGAELVLEDGGERFVRDVQRERGGRWVSAPLSGKSLPVPECSEGCRLRYRFLLGEAAEALRNPQSAGAVGTALVSPPSLWLLHPAEPALVGYRLSIRASPGSQVLCGLSPSADPDTYQSTAGLRVTPLCAFGGWRVRTLAVGPAQLILAVAPVSFSMTDEEMAAWVSEAAQAVARYYRRFPVEHLLLLVVPSGVRGLSGFTLGEGGASILLRLGTGMPSGAVRSDWVLTHELMHLGFPTLWRKHLWMEEGMAVFGEPIVRVRAGMLDEAALWSEWIEQGPLGLPRPGEGGLEVTHTWARTYWGGALFWLIADVTLRERTANTRSVDDVLRALVAAGGNATSHWEMEDVLRVADGVSGVPVFTELFQSMAEAPAAPDLAALFRRLGVSLRGGAVVYDDNAPLASVRRAMVGRSP
ncbi:MAG: hypothetical protein ACLPJH_00620 [Myxococcaceae bacterium]